jgi:hypothetical protein
VRQNAAVEMMRTNAPVEHPERSGPETLHDILACLDVNSSGYSEDRFKVLSIFVKNRN